MKPMSATLFACLLLTTAAFAQAPMHDHATMNHDVMFVDAMTKHHQDGIRMAQLAIDKAENAELRSMAQKMIDDQRNEIDRMQSLRGDAAPTPMSEVMKMPGMMSQSQMQSDMERLQSARGRDFDLAFTEIMPKHHEGAIVMAQGELQKGSIAGLKEIAQTIVDKQSRERQQLLALHDEVRAAPAAMTSSSTERNRLTKD